jgi:hypothetical protein
LPAAGVAAYIARMTEKNETGGTSAPAAESPKPPRETPRPREVGGPKGPEPTRYGDWEINGRCSDF